MKITKIEIENFLSFKEKQSIEIDKFNLLVGPNNEGKSNVLKCVQFLGTFFHLFAEHKINNFLTVGGISQKDADLTNRLNFLKNNEDLFFAQNNDKKINFCIGLEFENKEIENIFSSRYNNSEERKLLKFLFGNNLRARKIIEIEGNFSSHKKEVFFLRIVKIYFPEGEPEFKHLFYFTEKHGYFLEKDNSNTMFYEESAKDGIDNRTISRMTRVVLPFFGGMEELFLGSIKFIPAVRAIKEHSYRKEINHEDFSKTTEILMKLRDGNYEERQRFDQIKEFIRKLAYSKIPESELNRMEIIFPRNEEDDNHLLKLNVDESILPLSQLGSGIEQIIYLATEILSKKRGTIFLIEEPELNFHAKLQRKFLKFLQEDLIDEEYQFFITSHSSVLIDPFFQEKDAKVFQVKMNKGGEFSKIIPINDNNSADLFFELGIRGTDIMQSNGIIWVEGPSDRVYLLKWLNLYVEKNKFVEFKEGRDFSILFYGGSILSSFSLKDAEINNNELEKQQNDFINILRINRNAVVLMDRDEEKGKKWKTKQRIKREAQKVSGENGFTWMTEGREIENYLTKKVINRTFPKKIKTSYEINEKEQPFKNWFRQGESGVYENCKKEFAKKVAENITWDDIDENPELEKKLTKLYKAIQLWNE